MYYMALEVLNPNNDKYIYMIIQRWRMTTMVSRMYCSMVMAKVGLSTYQLDVSALFVLETHQLILSFWGQRKGNSLHGLCPCVDVDMCIDLEPTRWYMVTTAWPWQTAKFNMAASEPWAMIRFGGVACSWKCIKTTTKTALIFFFWGGGEGDGAR